MQMPVQNNVLSRLQVEQLAKTNVKTSSHPLNRTTSSDQLSQEHSDALIALHQLLVAETKAFNRIAARLNGSSNEEMLLQSLEALRVSCTDFGIGHKEGEAKNEGVDESKHDVEGIDDDDDDDDDDEDYQAANDDDNEEEDSDEYGSENEDQNGDDDEIESVTITSTQDFTGAVLELCMRDAAALKLSRNMVCQAAESVMKRISDERTARHVADNNLKQAKIQNTEQESLLQELRGHMENIIEFHTSIAESQGTGDGSKPMPTCKPWSPQNLELFREACYEAVHAARHATAGAWVSVKECMSEKKLHVEDTNKKEGVTVKMEDKEDIVMQPEQGSVCELSE